MSANVMCDDATESRTADVSGEFVTLAGERYYAIRNVDKMAPFFISLVSDSDHWMFVASNGGLTAGRVSPDTALFPYVTVDKIYDSTPHTGCKTVLRVDLADEPHYWEPFTDAHNHRYATTRNLYKNLLGNKLLFEEFNHDLQLVFRYSWQFSDDYGFVRDVELKNLATDTRHIEIVDGLQNLLPAGTPRFTQTNSSNLVDAYKWNELHAASGLALVTLFSGISDRAEPCESLTATTVFCLGLDDRRVLLSNEQLDDFRAGRTPTQEAHKRGIRSAYLVHAVVDLAAQSSQSWQLVANIEQSQADAVALLQALADPETVAAAILRSVANGSDSLARIMAAADGFQATAEENVSAHHYANVLFNVLRGGIAADQYSVNASDVRDHVKRFNRDAWLRHRPMLDALPVQLDYGELLARAAGLGDPQFERLVREFLPFTFGRRHGDPSRPWNQFAIRLTDDHGKRLLTYQGNWRDIFQNWEALLLSFPEYTDSVIAKFVNASTIDGNNPYRINDAGFDWEVEDEEDPWSYIGYWGDHQIIYLLKLLELSHQFHPERLDALLTQPLYCYANVPYRIKPFDDLLADAKSTVVYDQDLATRIEQRVEKLGADGKLLVDANGDVCQVTLLEKLLVSLLAKLGNLVLDGGIWLNTQRPEWNDANNALVGQGLSMVTLCYLRRYVAFMQRLLKSAPDTVTLSSEVSDWLGKTAVALRAVHGQLNTDSIDTAKRFALLDALGRAASDYRQSVYASESFSGSVTRDRASIAQLLDDAMAAIDHSVRTNRRDDGLYHAYNLLHVNGSSLEIDTLYPMLEGQVAALSCGAMQPVAAVELLDALFASDLYRDDQDSFLLYPDRKLPTFLEKNRVPAADVESLELLRQMLEHGDRSIIARDAGGDYRFNADLKNVGDLNAKLDELAPVYGDIVEAARKPLGALYEQVFDHKSFTGRSGGMFGFEGLGSIYWHMVAKLLLAVQEVFFDARTGGADADVCQRLGEHYYRVREGIGFNKTPEQYGAFPTDPYSHTPGHAGAQQPGMTGQVKEELLTRFGELGVRVADGAVRFDPSLLRSREFVDAARFFRFVDVSGQWQEVNVPQHGLAFTWCQVPFVYRLATADEPGVRVELADDQILNLPDLAMPADLATELFHRSGRIRRVDLVLNAEQLHD